MRAKKRRREYEGSIYTIDFLSMTDTWKTRVKSETLHFPGSGKVDRSGEVGEIVQPMIS